MTDRPTERRIRHIIKPPGAYEAFRALASRYDLTIIDKIERDPRSPIALEEIFGTSDHTVGVHYIEDGLSELPYIQVAGPQAEHYSQLIVQHLPIYSETELLSSWDEADSLDDKIDAILRIGVSSAPDVSEPYRDRIRQALEDTAPAVRSAALTAFSYNPWEELRPFVQRICDKDTDEDARARARTILNIWKVE